MRLRQRPAPWILFLLPALVVASSFDSGSSKDTSYLSSSGRDSSYRESSYEDPDKYSTTNKLSSGKVDLGTKVAPVDGKDGMPKDGPFVTTEKERQKQSIDDPDYTDYSSSNIGSSSGRSSSYDSDSNSGSGSGYGSSSGSSGSSYSSGSKSGSSEYSTKDRSSSPMVIDGVEIPETNDGVMDDPNRRPPKQGTTGTEGGVSQKDRERKAKEGMTGERVENIPETPKEIPQHSSSNYADQDSYDDDTKVSSSKSSTYHTSDDVTGFEKPADLPEKYRDDPNPIPNSAQKDHLDFSSGKSSSSSSTSKSKQSFTADADSEADGIIQPFHSFVLSFTMILFSEIGDKTFLVAALMAMKHDRMIVFSAAFGALAVMTVLSAVLGHAVPALIPKKVTSFLASGLFFVFGAKLLREGMAMDPNEGVTSEMQEVEMELQEKEQEALKRGGRRPSAYALEGGFNRKSRSEARFPSPPRSPSQSPPRSPSPRGGLVGGVGSGLSNLFSLLLSPAWVQTFIMTFLGEWGDRSQIATIAMAAGQDYWWVTLGALGGHAICTGVAVIGGRAIAGRVSLKVVTVGGAVAFLVFGVIYLFEAFYG